jgi:immune inhibitor A
MAYFSQRFGAELTKALVAHPANGIRGIDAVLTAAGLGSDTGLGFEGVFADWVVANYVDDPNALGRDGVFGYRNFTQEAPVVDQTYDHYPTDIRDGRVHNYATDYVLLNGSGDITIHFTGQNYTHLADVQAYSGQYAWWSNRGDDFDTRLSRAFDLRDVAPGTPVEMDVTMWWEIEEDYDYGYVLVSRDGSKWDIVAGERATTDDPGGNSFGAGYTGKSASDGERLQWVTEQFDLSPYVGSEIVVRFEYVTDDAVNSSGWFVDDIRIPAVGYSSDFEGGNDGWESEGWLLTNNQMAQRWLLQLLSFEDNRLIGVERYPVDEIGNARIDVDRLGDGKTAVLAISALAPVTTEPADYKLQILR